MVEENIWALRLRAAKIPFIIVSVFYLLSLITALTSFSLYESIFMSSFLGPVILIASFTIGAYISLVDYNIPKKRIVQGGVVAGIGIGLLAAIISIILLKNTSLLDSNVALLMEKAAELGSPVSESIAATQIMLGSYIALFFSPIINGGLGALFAWIGTLVTAKFESMHRSKKKELSKKDGK